MRWEELTSPNFKRAVKEVKGLCVIPMGILEKHGEHLPLGTDLFTATAMVESALKIEPAIMFPPYFFGQINCARHQYGTMSLRRDVQLALLENVCDEIARNGLKKIAIVNAHGGNSILLSYFLRTTLEKKRDYVVYYIPATTWRMKKPHWDAMNMPEGGGHGGRDETSRVMAARPGLVRMQDMAQPRLSMKRTAPLEGAEIAVAWYANTPECCGGDATEASEERGKIQFDQGGERIAKVLKAIKEDDSAARLTQEFYALAEDER
ncbi:MAG: creatininase family protein [Planctomycetes bacterium]|nr:creatininase family protein [Planctomycetota bacterium]